ncbi:restriction endonuclease subunit S [Flavivirga amylovorans]|uniref:Restriction endonuclease subunit S n=1 Tax=Flavivirga amylovorans TaxID=870486 RepID=A0ABT8X3C3_9FLAO|nr:restriction endonuclease subunit S [Flavivirga amylovorans]MDO5988089.1 restriction endonuclease subunit S [Flavivirga amylovorans]
MENKEIIPKLRFPEFTEDWVKKRLDYFVRRSDKKNKELKFTKKDVLSVAAKVGVVNQMKYHGRSYAGVSVKPYNILLKNELVYTKSPLKEYPYGVMKYNDFEDGIVSTLYAIYAAKDNSSPKFIDYYFYHIPRINRYLKPLVNIGAKNDMKVNNSTVLSGNVIFPKLIEQQKIADFLTSIDRRINLLNKKKDYLINYKKGVMQKIFNKEIRFKDDYGNDFPDWEEKKANQIFRSYTNKNHNSDLPILSASQKEGMIYREKSGIKIQSSAKSVKSYKIVEPNDFVITLRSFQGGIDFSNKLGICSPAYTILKNIVPIDYSFYKFYFKKERFINRLSKTTIGIRDGKQITFENFGNLFIPYPNLEEQAKIASYITALDIKIDTLKNKIDTTEDFKKGLLQKMFV